MYIITIAYDDILQYRPKREDDSNSNKDLKGEFTNFHQGSRGDSSRREDLKGSAHRKNAQRF